MSLKTVRYPQTAMIDNSCSRSGLAAHRFERQSPALHRSEALAHGQRLRDILFDQKDRAARLFQLAQNGIDLGHYLGANSEILARAVRLTSVASILLMEEFVLRSNVIGGTSSCHSRG